MKYQCQAIDPVEQFFYLEGVISKFMRILILLLTLTLGFQARAVPVTTTVPASETSTGLTLEDIRDLNNKELRKKFNRKLTFKESIAFRILRGKLKRAQKRAANKKTAANGFTVAEAGLFSSTVGLIGVVLATFAVSGVGGIWILGLIGLILGIVLGAIGKQRFKASDPKKYNMSNLAFWLGTISIIVLVAIILIALVALTGFY